MLDITKLCLLLDCFTLRWRCESGGVARALRTASRFAFRCVCVCSINSVCDAHRSTLRPAARQLRHREFSFFAASQTSAELGKWTQNSKLREWVDEQVKLFAPEHVHLCDGTSTFRRCFSSKMLHSRACLCCFDVGSVVYCASIAQFLFWLAALAQAIFGFYFYFFGCLVVYGFDRLFDVR
jgi:hypothetical protein